MVVEYCQSYFGSFLETKICCDRGTTTESVISQVPSRLAELFGIHETVGKRILTNHGLNHIGLIHDFGIMHHIDCWIHLNTNHLNLASSSIGMLMGRPWFMILKSLPAFPLFPLTSWYLYEKRFETAKSDHGYRLDATDRPVELFLLSMPLDTGW